MKRVALILMLMMVPVFGLGNPGCPGDDDDATEPVTEEPTAEPATPAPGDVGDALIAGFNAGKAGIDVAEALGTIDKPPQFHPCMAADGGRQGLDMMISTVPEIVAEAENPDCEFTVKGGPLDFSRCMTMEGKPDPWPPTEPDPNAEAVIKGLVPIGVLATKGLIEQNLPEEGDGCIAGKIVISVLGDEDEGFQQLMTQTVIDAANGADTSVVPTFTVKYSGCGLDCGN